MHAKMDGHVGISDLLDCLKAKTSAVYIHEQIAKGKKQSDLGHRLKWEINLA